MPLIMKYYIRYDDEYKGPFTLEEVKQLALTRSTYVWRKGIPDWTRAGELEEFHFLPLEETPTTPIQTTEPPASKTRFRLWIIVFLIVCILTLALAYRFMR